MEQKAKGQNYYVNTKGKQVLSIAIWTMNKTDFYTFVYFLLTNLQC